MDRRQKKNLKLITILTTFVLVIIIAFVFVLIKKNQTTLGNVGNASQDLISNNVDNNTTGGIAGDGEPIKRKTASQEQIQAVLDSMTVDNKIGQLLFARVPEKNIIETISRYSLGGYILFGRDVNNLTLSQIRDKVFGWQDGQKIGLFIGIDEEGGLVSRLSYAGLADFKSPRELLGEDCGLCEVKKDTRKKTSMLEDLGINVNFAPVADLCDDPDSFITSRTAGADPTFVSEYINAVTNIYTYESTVSATLKHFPGYGCNVDTHTGIAIDERTLEDYRSRDFLPFSAGIKAGADFVMVSHNVINKVDSNNPASLSPEIHRILNEELGFTGVTITDDLSMDAIAEYYHGDYPATVQAVLAGNNMLIVSDIETAFNEIKNAVSAGLIDESRLDLVLAPVIKLKIEKDLITL